MTIKQEKEFLWSEYYKVHHNRPANTTLLKGLDYFKLKKLNLSKTAVDIGCGNGNDTIELLKNNFSVLAMDKEEEAIDLLIKNVPAQNSNLETQVVSMEKFIVPQVSLINASYSLPFCHPDQFNSLMNDIKNNLPDQGIFCGQLFGLEDGWSNNTDMTFHSHKQVEAIFKNFKFIYFNEINEQSATADGEPKHWHLFHITAVKQS